MNQPEESPLASASLATDEAQGADARACGQCVSKDTARAACLRAILVLLIEVLCDLLDSFAMDVEIPPAGFLESRDKLDEVRERLLQGDRP